MKQLTYMASLCFSFVMRLIFMNDTFQRRKRIQFEQIFESVVLGIQEKIECETTRTLYRKESTLDR